MPRLSFGLCGVLALALPPAAWAQAQPPSLSDQIEQRLQQMRKPQQPGGGPPVLAGSELNQLMNRLRECWAVPPALRDAANLAVTVHVKLAKDGALAEPPKVVDSNADPRFAAMAKSAVAAVTKCAPFGFLPAARYAAWREIEITFDARVMFGDKPR
jgi:colicin import membrane protein